MANMREITHYAVSVADDHRDSIGEINLTAVEEDVRIQFDLSDEEFEDRDVSFNIWKVLQSRGLLD